MWPAPSQYDPHSSRHIIRRRQRPSAVLGSAKVQNDFPTLTAYAVDASIYRMTPQAVVLVESEDDIDRVVRFAVSRGIPLTPRAAGTNLTGSAIGSGIILDVSKMNRILEVNEQERWARVQPGIVLAELNRQLSRRQSALRSRSLPAGRCASSAGWWPTIPPVPTPSSMVR